METKDPLVRTTAQTCADSAEQFLGNWKKHAKAGALAALGVVVGWGVKPAPKPTPVVPLSTRQAVVPVQLDGCSYWFATFGEATNANWSASLTHSGSCTNWIAHKALSQ